MPRLTDVMLERPELLLAQFHEPAVTAYNRLEARPRAHDFTRSLRAEVRDGLWLLTRQWQLGELEAEDAGSAVDARLLTRKLTIDRIRLGAGAPEPYDDTLPLEAAVERERVPFTHALRVQADWNALPPGRHEATLTLRGSDGTQVNVAVPAWKPAADATIHGFVERDGQLAIEAAHHSDAIAADGQQWLVIPNLGRTHSGMTAWPATAPARMPDSGAPRLEYPIHLRDDGQVRVRVDQCQLSFMAGGQEDIGHALLQAVDLVDGCVQAEIVGLLGDPGRVLVDVGEGGNEGVAAQRIHLLDRYREFGHRPVLSPRDSL